MIRSNSSRSRDASTQPVKWWNVRDLPSTLYGYYSAFEILQLSFRQVYWGNVTTGSDALRDQDLIVDPQRTDEIWSIVQIDA